MIEIDTDVFTPTYGDVVNTWTNSNAVHIGTHDMHGVAATPVRDSNGYIDAIFAFVDSSPRGVRLIDMQGEGGMCQPV